MVFLTVNHTRVSDMNHKYESHNNCENDLCPVCTGGVCHCTICKATEAALTSDCVGRPLTSLEACCISNGYDFKDGEWLVN